MWRAGPSPHLCPQTSNLRACLVLWMPIWAFLLDLEGPSWSQRLYTAMRGRAKTKGFLERTGEEELRKAFLRQTRWLEMPFRPDNLVSIPRTQVKRHGMVAYVWNSRVQYVRECGDELPGSWKASQLGVDSIVKTNEILSQQSRRKEPTPKSCLLTYTHAIKMFKFCLCLCAVVEARRKSAISHSPKL